MKKNSVILHKHTKSVNEQHEQAQANSTSTVELSYFSKIFKRHKITQTERHCKILARIFSTIGY
jgi:hypothetical protein